MVVAHEGVRGVPFKEMLAKVRDVRTILRHLQSLVSVRNLDVESLLILIALRESAGGESVAALLTATGTTPATASRHIDLLATRGLIFREISPSDRRVTLLYLSRLGARLLEQLELEAEAELSYGGKPLSKVDPEG
jgi:DNA-binding MarR family transcriptional regulator